MSVTEPPLADSFGRIINYLRLSITDRCNLRCRYCMPAEGVAWLPHEQVITFEEMLRLVQLLAGMGITAVKVTGGEPLVRREAAALVKELKATAGVNRVSMTSNGLLLAEYLPSLVSAGLDAINISIDTLDPAKYSMLTGSNNMVNILPLIDRILTLDIPVKINCVPIKGFNENEITALAALARDRNITVRFIELMPIGIAREMRPVPQEELVTVIKKEYGVLEPTEEKTGNGPAVCYRPRGFVGRIGFISPLSHRFCGNCNRLRLNAAGVLRVCLSGGPVLDMRTLIRKGVSDTEMVRAVRKLAVLKPAGYTFGEAAADKMESINDTNNAVTGMFRIGG